MSATDRLARLDTVARRLTFPLDDHDAANAAFAAWRAALAANRPADAALEQVEVWAYCYVQRHALVRFTREPGLGGGADLDALISTTFLHVRSRLDHIRDPDRFTRWVAVACRNHFITYCRQRALRPIRSDADPESFGDASSNESDDPLELDRALIHRVVNGAIERLPETLRMVARLRLLERRGYDEIASATGRPPATIRAYVAKAAARLRDDRELRALRAELAGDIVERGRLKK